MFECELETALLHEDHFAIISSTRVAVQVLPFSPRFDLLCGMTESSSFCVVAHCMPCFDVAAAAGDAARPRWWGVIQTNRFVLVFLTNVLAVCVTMIVCMVARVVSLRNEFERVKCLTTLRIAPQSLLHFCDIQPSVFTLCTKLFMKRLFKSGFDWTWVTCFDNWIQKYVPEIVHSRRLCLDNCQGISVRLKQATRFGNGK